MDLTLGALPSPRFLAPAPGWASDVITLSVSICAFASPCRHGLLAAWGCGAVLVCVVSTVKVLATSQPSHHVIVGPKGSLFLPSVTTFQLCHAALTASVTEIHVMLLENTTFVPVLRTCVPQAYIVRLDCCKTSIGGRPTEVVSWATPEMLG